MPYPAPKRSAEPSFLYAKLRGGHRRRYRIMEPPDFMDVFGPDPTGGLREMRNLGIALRMIREAVEDCAPPGSVPCGEYMFPEPWLEAEALVRGIYAIAYGKAADE